MTSQNGIFQIQVDLQREDMYVNIDNHGTPVHADEFLAIAMISMAATRKWVEENQTDGRIVLDLPGSKFSDKTGLGEDGKKKESTSKKVARSLGLLGDPKWRKIIRYVDRDDMKGSSNYRDICTLAKLGQLQNSRFVLRIAHWFFKAIYVKWRYDADNADLSIDNIRDVIRKNQAELDGIVDADKFWKFGDNIHRRHKGKFFEKAMAERDEKFAAGQIFLQRILHKGKEIVVSAVESENYRMSAALSKRFGGVTIVKFPELTLVKGAFGEDIETTEILAVLRYCEHRRKNPLAKRSFSRDKLRAPGSLEGVEEWFFQIETGVIMNSTSHGSRMSRLNLREIFSCALIALDQNRLYPDQAIARQCRKGVCVYGQDCLNMQVGLPRCTRLLKENAAA